MQLVFLLVAIAVVLVVIGLVISALKWLVILAAVALVVAMLVGYRRDKTSGKSRSGQGS